MQDLTQKISELKANFSNFSGSFNEVAKKAEIAKLTAESTDPNLWNDQERAKSLMQKLGDFKKEVEEFQELKNLVSTLDEFSQKEELKEDLEEEYHQAAELLDKFRLTTYLSGNYDGKNAILSLHAGQGGTEAMDWVSMLYRMYLRFCERRNWETAILDMTPGEEAGIKSVTIKVSGHFAYGYLKREAGTHRLVRQSPFNADKLRQTSFALVEVLPELSSIDLPDIEIKGEDLDWQFFRASSQGGQNVQKVSSAVRLKHLPSGIVVTAQAERFQEQNRKNALNLLRGKLWLLEKAKAKDTKKELKGQYRPASWGTQIRSYVLHPYKMVKDLRTQVETSNTEAVLDGDLGDFIEAELREVKE